MSHHKVKSIQIKDGKVFVTGKCNNDTEPVKKWECTSLSEILKEKGQKAVEIEILKAFEDGQFQSSGDHKYTRALRSLQQMPVYKNFNWRNTSYKEGCPIEAARKSEEFTQLLEYALSIKPKSGKYILIKPYFGDILFCLKKTSRRISWTRTKAMAKIFKYKEDVERLKRCFEGGEQWKIESI